jgi:hypothetical protein
MVAMMKILLKSGKCSEQWKEAKTVNIYKESGENDAAKWRPITLTSILYIIIFGRISQVMMAFEDRKEKKIVFASQQKGFVPRISRCGQQTYMANLAINRAMIERK